MSVRSPTDRTRNYTTIVYPESAPEGWLKILKDLQVPAVVSPLHNLDVHDDGQLKKEHFHVMIMFDSVKTLKQAKDVCISFGGVGCEKVISTRKMLRYFCHLDEQDKPIYDTEQVTVIGDIDYNSIIESSTDDITFLRNITFFIHANHITNFTQFMCDVAMNNPEWFRVISRSATIYVKALIDGERYLT